jgi:hypothetical protein
MLDKFYPATPPSSLCLSQRSIPETVKIIAYSQSLAPAANIREWIPVTSTGMTGRLKIYPTFVAIGQPCIPSSTAGEGRNCAAPNQQNEVSWHYFTPSSLYSLQGSIPETVKIMSYSQSLASVANIRE